MALNAIEQEIDAHLAQVEASEDWQERIDARAEQYAKDDAKRREAEEWIAGFFDGEHYTQVTLAFHDMHHNGLTDGVKAKLHALAKVEADALDEKLAEMAGDDIRAEAERDALNAAEIRAEMRAAK